MIGEKIVIQFSTLEKAHATIVKIFKSKLPGDISYWLDRNIKNIQKEVKEIDKEKMKLVKQYGVYIPKENKYFIAPDNEKFKEEYKKIGERKIEIVINKIEISKLHSLQLSPEEIGLIDFMICENHKIFVCH